MSAPVNRPASPNSKPPETVENPSGIPLKTVYTSADLQEIGFDEARDLGPPGQYPYTRGIHPTMYRGRHWTMRQYAGYATAEESNRRYHYLLQQGQTGLSIAFDLPTQMGYDSDHPMALGEVGKVGVPISSLRDMEILLEGIPLDKVTTSMTINATASILLAFYIAVAKQQGVPQEALSGTIQNDILKEYIARGTYIYPPRPSMRLVVDVFKYCAQHMPKWNTISISGYHMREAGATAVQELAFTFANAIEYVQAALGAGLRIDDFAPRLSFFFAAHNNLFEEVAKFRAARRMWARIMRERFQAQDPRSWLLRFHTQTAGVTLTAQQPLNNVIRCTIQALAAVLGGTQSLHVNSYDEALALPTEEAVRLSLRTQQILAYESGVADVVDPLGGSYYVEWLTTRLEQEAQRYLDKIEELGGALAALERGYQQREIHESAYRFQEAVEQGRAVIVGVNRFTIEEPPPKDILRISPEAVRRQIERLHEVRRRRDNLRVQRTLARLEEVARSDENTVPAILECVEAYCTIGEMCDVLRRVFGEQKHPAGV
ncbi:MAG: methylmalonyl-CoA mutase family protein [Dehalococcoidia bacterium]|nr:methylmalonyl-CoA mutase family protein [Dehalococcoidia bacterium]MDW8119675.1 methylmalonyl-CoA mutase family protein [Chloroflexota bacterium]